MWIVKYFILKNRFMSVDPKNLDKELKKKMWVHQSTQLKLKSQYMDIEKNMHSYVDINTEQTKVKVGQIPGKVWVD